MLKTKFFGPTFPLMTHIATSGFYLLLMSLVLQSLSFENYPWLPNTNGVIIATLLITAYLCVSIASPKLGNLNAVVVASYASGITLYQIIATREFMGNDVYWMVTQAVDFLIRFQNPYSQYYTWIPLHNRVFAGPLYSFSYPPGVVFLAAPSYLLFQDIRYALFAAWILTAAIVYLVLRGKNEIVGRLAAISLLIIPRLGDVYYYQLLSGITGPIGVFFIALTVLLEARGKPSWAAVSAGLALLSRQFALLFLIPLFYWHLRNKRYRPVLLAIAVVLLACFPFFVWSPSDFIYGVLLFNVHDTLSPSLGSPQWNLAIFPQLTMYGIFFPTKVVLLLGFVAYVAFTSAYLRRLTDVFQVLAFYCFSYVLFLTLSSYTQFFYYMDVVPLLPITYGRKATTSY